jgi:crossover junction endodeoxyribonuclease RuvC
MDAPARTPPKRPSHDGCLLGVDPGLQRTGYAILVPTASGEPRLVEAGVIRLSRSLPLTERLLELDRSLTELTRNFRPAAMACEELYSHYRHPRTAILMGHARGVVLVCAARSGLPVIPISATRAKKLLTGRGHAGKPQMQRAAAAMLRLNALPEPHDVADAIAIALAGLRLRHAEALLTAEGGA